MKKILFGITSLTIGGAERVLVDLANRLKDDYDITILCIYGNGELEKELDKKIKLITLRELKYSDYNKIDHFMTSLDLLFRIKPPKNYDIYVSFLEGPITRLFAKKIGYNKCKKGGNKENQTKKIVWIHNDISKVFGSGIKAKIKKYFDRNIYKKYDKLIFVSEENKEDFNNFYKKAISEEKEEVIRNYLDYEKVIKKSEEKVKIPFDENSINLVSVCRLVPQKAIDRFIKVHKNLENLGMHSKVYIIGDGPMRYALQKQIDKAGETDKFILLGQKENPYPYIKNADYFCLLSYYEGYGMVLDEAKILNKKIIITDTAAKESLKKYEKSYVLNNNEKDITEGLNKILSQSLNETEEINKKQITTEELLKRAKKYYDSIIEKIKENF